VPWTPSTQPRRARVALHLSPAWRCGRGERGQTRLTNLGVESEIADEVPRRGESADVTDDRHERSRGGNTDSWNGHESLDVVGVKGVDRDISIDKRDLSIQEVDLSQAGIDRLAFIDRELQLRQPHASLSAEQIRGRGAALEVALQNRMDLVLGLGALLDELSSSRDTAPHHSTDFITGPHLREKARGEKLDQRPGVDLVGLDPGSIVPTALALASTTRSTQGSRMRTIASALP
jgi:hypothetical protein